MKLGRNDPCWCGSGKKYKACHARMDERIEAIRLEGHIVPGHAQIKNEEQLQGIRESSKLNIAILDEILYGCGNTSPLHTLARLLTHVLYADPRVHSEHFLPVACIGHDMLEHFGVTHIRMFSLNDMVVNHDRPKPVECPVERGLPITGGAT